MENITQKPVFWKKGIKMIVLPTLVVGMAQLSGCSGGQNSGAVPPGGVYVSNSAGALFEQAVKVDGAEGQYIAGLSLSDINRPAHDPSRMYMAAGAQGVLWSDNDAASWKVITTPLAVVRGVVVMPDETMLISGTDANGQGFILRSQDEAKSWETVLTVPVPLQKKKFTIFPQKPRVSVVVTIKQGILNPDLVYAGTSLGGIFIGENSGKVWRNTINLRTFHPSLGEQGATVFKIIPSPHAPDELLAVTTSGKVFLVSGDQQKDLKFKLQPPADPRSNAPRNLSLGIIRDAAFVPGFPDTVLVSGKNGAAFSYDRGEIWAPFTLPLDPNQKFNETTISVSPTNPDRFFATFNSVLYRSEDGGENWNTFDFGLTSFVITSVNVDPRNAAKMFVVTAPVVF